MPPHQPVPMIATSICLMSYPSEFQKSVADQAGPAIGRMAAPESSVILAADRSGVAALVETLPVLIA
jgi:hypothetical protein